MLDLTTSIRGSSLILKHLYKTTATTAGYIAFDLDLVPGLMCHIKAI
jgi:hypothetical protein